MTRARVTDRPKLLFTVNDGRFFLSHFLPLARAAGQAGFDVHVVTAPGPANDEIAAQDLTHHTIRISRSGLNPLREVGTLLSLYRVFRRVSPILVHNITIKPVVYGGLCARMARVPAMVSTVTGLGHVFIANGAGAAILRTAVRVAYGIALRHGNRRIIFENPNDRDEFIDQGLADQEACVVIRGAGVDTMVFASRPEAPGLPVVVLPARMLWEKGVGEFVEVAQRLRAESVNARFALVGDTDPGNPSAVPRERLKQWHDTSQVEWWGFRDDMAAVLAQAHIVCLPSYREGLPKSLIEAAACARPIVATDVPGCREIARDRDNAILVPPRDPAALAKALHCLIDDAVLRRRLGARGREIAVAEFSLDRVIAETLEVYRGLLAEIGRPAPRPEKGEKVQCHPG